MIIGCTAQRRWYAGDPWDVVVLQYQGGGTAAPGSGRDRQVHTSVLAAESRKFRLAREAVSTNLISDGRGLSRARRNRSPGQTAAFPASPLRIFTPFW